MGLGLNGCTVFINGYLCYTDPSNLSNKGSLCFSDQDNGNSNPGSNYSNPSAGPSNTNDNPGSSNNNSTYNNTTKQDLAKAGKIAFFYDMFFCSDIIIKAIKEPTSYGVKVIRNKQSTCIRILDILNARTVSSIQRLALERCLDFMAKNQPTDDPRVARMFSSIISRDYRINIYSTSNQGTGNLLLREIEMFRYNMSQEHRKFSE